MDNWYQTKGWKLWGHRHKRKILLTKSTKMLESHRSLLSRLLVLLYNRPRLETFFFIIKMRLFSKFKSSLQQLASDAQKLCWRKWFFSLGNKQKSPSKRAVYITNKNVFTCSFPAWLWNRLFICKHLVCYATFPFYGQVMIWWLPPFMKIGGEMNTAAAIIDDEHVVEVNCRNTVAVAPYEISPHFEFSYNSCRTVLIPKIQPWKN